MPRASRSTASWRCSGGCASAASARIPYAERLETIEEVAAACREWETRRIELDYEIDGIVIKVDSLDQQRRLGALHSPAALGARVQVGADDGRDEAARDPDPRRPDRRAQPVGADRARRGGRRHRHARDAPQRGGHQPQADPRGRRRHRPAGRRRHPADRRAGRGRAPARDEGVPDAEEVPALRHRDRQARGRGHAPLPEPRLPVTRPGDADHVDGRRRHRRRRRADDPHPLGQGPRPLAAGPLPADEGSSSSSWRASPRSPPPRRSSRSSARRRCRSPACCSG